MTKRDRTVRIPADECKTLSIPEAGRRYFNLGRNASYAAAKTGEIPTVPILGMRRVPIVLMDRMLEEAGTKPDGRPAGGPSDDPAPQPIAAAPRR